MDIKQKKCAWCGETKHATHECTNFGKGKWAGKQCNKCKGYNHPPAVCPNPGTKKLNAALVAVAEAA